MKNNIKLYNMIMPIWMTFIFPFTWFIILPFNYIVDSLALYITMKILKLKQKKIIYKISIFKIWILGFISDFIGVSILFIPILINNIFNLDLGYKKGLVYIIMDKLMEVTLNPFDNIYSIVLTTIAVVISAICIYFFNYNYSLKEAFNSKYITDIERKKIALFVAIFTAPYLFYLSVIYWI